MGNFIINFIISLMDFAFRVSIAPLLTFIANGIPNLDEGVNAFKSLVNLIFSNLSWLLDFTGLSDFAIDLIVGYFIFRFTAMIFEKPIKLFFKYWETLI